MPAHRPAQQRGVDAIPGIAVCARVVEEVVEQDLRAWAGRNSTPSAMLSMLPKFELVPIGKLHHVGKGAHPPPLRRCGTRRSRWRRCFVAASRAPRRWRRSPRCPRPQRAAGTSLMPSPKTTTCHGCASTMRCFWLGETCVNTSVRSARMPVRLRGASISAAHDACDVQAGGVAHVANRTLVIAGEDLHQSVLVQSAQRLRHARHQRVGETEQSGEDQVGLVRRHTGVGGDHHAPRHPRGCAALLAWWRGRSTAAAQVRCHPTARCLRRGQCGYLHWPSSASGAPLVTQQAAPAASTTAQAPPLEIEGDPTLCHACVSVGGACEICRVQRTAKASPVAAVEWPGGAPGGASRPSRSMQRARVVSAQVQGWSGR